MTIDYDAMADRCYDAGRQSAIDLAAEWEARAIAAEATVARLKAERLKLDKRIHNQRRALRETWEIVEMRRKWLGSDTARRWAHDFRKRWFKAYQECAEVADKEADVLLFTGARFRSLSEARPLYSDAELHEQAGTAIKSVVDKIRALAPPAARQSL